MALFFLILFVAVVVVIFSIRSAKKLQRAMLSKARSAIQSYASAANGARVQSTFTGVHPDGSPMSPQELQAFQPLADAAFASINGSADATLFKNGMGAMDPALAEKVRAQLDAQGFGKLGELVAQQMQNLGSGNVTISVDTPGAARPTYTGQREPEMPPQEFTPGPGFTPSPEFTPSPAFTPDPAAGSLNGSGPFTSTDQADPFASSLHNPFAAGDAFGGPSASAPPTNSAAQNHGASQGTSRSAASRMAALGVAQFASVARAVDGSESWAMDRERVGRPLQRVTAPAVPGVSLQPGDRVYINVDLNDDRFVTLATDLPAGYRVLSTGNDNRADPLVIGPALRDEGERAAGTVKAAERLQQASGGMPNAGTWRVTLEVAPERGFPFTSDLVAAFSTQDRADAVTRIGAVLPLFYDPQHPKTIAIDTQSMGFADR